MGSVIAVNVWKGIPFYTLLLLAGLKAIDSEQLEAAEVDGANAVQRFRYVTLPGLRYVILVVLLLSFISTFNQFGLIFLMTGGGPSGATKPLFDPRLREGDRFAAIRPGQRHRAQRCAAHGHPDLAARQVHAAGRPNAATERRQEDGIGTGIVKALRARLSACCSTSSSARSTCCSWRFEQLRHGVAPQHAPGRPTQPLFKPEGRGTHRHRAAPA